MQEIIISKNEAGQRFDKFLNKYFKEANSGFIYKMLRKKNIELNGKKASGNEKLNEKDSVKIFMSDDTKAKFRGIQTITDGKTESLKKHAEYVANCIVYDDENIILLNKPAGVLSQKAVQADISINEMIIDYMIYNGKITKQQLLTFKPSVCNRLDRNTTGLIAFGKTLMGVQELSKGFKDRSFDKYYLAVVWGRVEKASLIEGYLYKDTKTNKVSVTKHETSDSSYIETYYEPIKTTSTQIDNKDKDITLLKIKLITGKTHQIRAHLSSIGHSILGDDKYGVRRDNEFLKRTYKINYQMLHSYELHIGCSDEYIALKPIENRVFKVEPDWRKNGYMENERS